MINIKQQMDIVDEMKSLIKDLQETISQKDKEIARLHSDIENIKYKFYEC